MSSLSASVAETNVGQYVKLQEAKDALDFPDDLDDEELLGMVKDANQDIEMAITPHADTLPIPDGVPIFKACSRAGLIYVKARWKEKKHNFELAKTLDALYSEKMHYIVLALKSVPENRTKGLIVSTDPRDAKLPLPTQYSNFVFDDFA